MAQNDDSKIILYGGGLLILYFGILKPILEKLGLQTSQAQQTINNQAQVQNQKNPFSPIFWKSTPNPILLTKNSTIALAKRIYDAMGYFSDDESEVYSVFNQMKYQTQVSWLADIFQQQYKQDMYDFLKRGKGNLPQAGLSDTEMLQIINQVNKLPIKK
jgi:hypothetical protein